MNKTKATLALLSLAALCSCATANTAVVHTASSPGFWWGLLHGWFAGIAFIGSLFDSSIGVYEVANNGGWYDFGFILGIGSFAGGCDRCAK